MNSSNIGRSVIPPVYPNLNPNSTSLHEPGSDTNNPVSSGYSPFFSGAYPFLEGTTQPSNQAQTPHRFPNIISSLREPLLQNEELASQHPVMEIAASSTLDTPLPSPHNKIHSLTNELDKKCAQARKNFIIAISVSQLLILPAAFFLSLLIPFPPIGFMVMALGFISLIYLATTYGVLNTINSALINAYVGKNMVKDYKQFLDGFNTADNANEFNLPQSHVLHHEMNAVLIKMRALRPVEYKLSSAIFKGYNFAFRKKEVQSTIAQFKNLADRLKKLEEYTSLVTSEEKNEFLKTFKNSVYNILSIYKEKLNYSESKSMLFFGKMRGFFQTGDLKNLLQQKEEAFQENVTSSHELPARYFNAPEGIIAKNQLSSHLSQLLRYSRNSIFDPILNSQFRSDIKIISEFYFNCQTLYDIGRFDNNTDLVENMEDIFKVFSDAEYNILENRSIRYNSSVSAI